MSLLDCDGDLANLPRWGRKTCQEVDAFIRRWQGREGGRKRANYVSFLKELVSLLDLPSPDPADATTHEHNDYVFERAVRTHKDHAAGSTSTKKQLCS